MSFHENEVVASASLNTRAGRLWNVVIRFSVFSVLYFMGGLLCKSVIDYIEVNINGIIFGVLIVLVIILCIIGFFFIGYLCFYTFSPLKKILYQQGYLYFKDGTQRRVIIIENVLLDGITLELGGTYWGKKLFRENNLCDFEGKYTIAKRFRQNPSEFYSLINSIKENGNNLRSALQQ